MIPNTTNVPATTADAVRQIRVATRIMAVLQAAGAMDDENFADAVAEIEVALAVITRQTAPRSIALPVLTLGEVAARAQARSNPAHLQIVGGRDA